MGLGTPWWSGFGDASRWQQNWTGSQSGWFNMGTLPYLMLCVSRANLFQMPYSKGTAGAMQQHDPGYDTGYFYMDLSPATTRILATAVGLCGIGADTATARPQWVQLGNGTGIGAYHTGYGLTPQVATPAYRRAFYKTGFVYDAGATRYQFLTGAPTVEADVHILMPTPANYGSGRWYLYHYNPFAWFGTVPEVIAAIVLKMGQDASLVDQSAFDNAFDAYDLSTGDLPFTTAGGTIGSTYWFGLGAKHQIHCSRRVGQTVVDLVKECAKHSRDFYYVNEAGELSVNSYTRPNNTHAGLGLGDGIIGKVSRTRSLKYTVNDCVHSWGSGVRAYGNPENTSSVGDYSASEEAGLESYEGNRMIAAATNPASIARFGTLRLQGTKRSVNRTGQPIEVSAAHYPFILNSNNNLAGQGCAHIAPFIDIDAQAKTLIEVEQDFRALDWGIGDEVTDVAVTGDGETIASTRCIERTYDFDRMTARSLLMEIPE